MEEDQDEGPRSRKEYCKRSGGTVCSQTAGSRFPLWAGYGMAAGI